MTEQVRVRSLGLEPRKQEGVTCCYAKSDKFWLNDADDVPWEMYTVLEDVAVETASTPDLREFLGQASG